MNTPQAKYSIHYSVTGGKSGVVPLVDHLTIGSSSDADLQIDSSYMSRRHLQVQVSEDGVFITALGRNETTLSGTVLASQQRYEWIPGQFIHIADIRLDLRVVENEDTQEGRAQYTEMMHLSASPEIVKVGEELVLTLDYRGQRGQSIYYEAHVDVDGLHVQIVPSSHFAEPDQRLEVQALVSKSQPFFTGGRYPIHLVAITPEGEMARADVVVELRPRWELFLILLLFIPTVLVVAASVFLSDEPIQTPTVVSVTPIRTTILTETSAPTETAIPTDEASETAITETISPSPTETITVSPSATFIISPTTCFNQCAALGWSSYTLQAGDQLGDFSETSGVSIAEIARVNCIADPNVIVAGTNICVPQLPPREPLCEGFVATSPLDGVAEGVQRFYWNPTANAVSYRLVLNAGEGGVVSRDVDAPTTFTDVDMSVLPYAESYSWYVVATLVDGSACDTPVVTVLVPAPPPLPSDTPSPEPTREPDLVVNSLTPNDNSRGWDSGCSNYNVALSPDFTVKNNGTGAADASVVSLYIYDDSSFNTLLWSDSSDVDIPALAAGNEGSGSGSVDAAFSSQEISNSDFYLVVLADANNQVTESNEGNNKKSQRIVVDECTDISFLAANVDFSVEEDTRNNETYCQIVVTYDYTLQNLGISDASEVDVSIAVSDGTNFSDTNITVLSGSQVTGGGVRDPYIEEQGSSLARPAASLTFTFTVSDDKDNNSSNNTVTRTLDFPVANYSCAVVN